MIETVASGLRSLGSPFTGTASWQRRSASLSGRSRISHTSRSEGAIGIQNDSDHGATVESFQKTYEKAMEMAEGWKKKAEEAEERARLAETRLAESNRRRSAEHTTFNPRVERQVFEAEHRINHLEAALAKSEQELRRTNDELRDALALLDTRSAELRDAQAYLSHPDDVADAEVLRLVERINSRIFQTAASIADAFQSRYGEQKNTRISQDTAAHMQRLLGDEFQQVLCSIDHSDDSVVVQTAIQAVLVTHAYWNCATWDFGITGDDQVLQNVYYYIRRREQQSVAGRWRALSRMYVKMFLKKDVDLQQSGVDGLVRDIMDILLVCGVAQAPGDLRTEVEGSYGDALREVIHLSLEFQRIAGEAIISRDLLLLAARSGKPFDVSRMVDEWADPKKAPRGENTHSVLCTTQLGLIREDRKAAEGGGREGIVAVVLLKPKVVLTSFLEELLA